MKSRNLLFNLNSLQRIFLVALLAIGTASCEKVDDLFEEVDKGKDKKMTKLFTSTNTGGNFAIFDVSDPGNVDISVANVNSESNDGIYYDKDKGVVYQVSRSLNQVNAYSSIDDIIKNDTTAVMADFSSPSNLSSGREITVKGDIIVVADQVPDNHKFIVYRRDGYGITLEKTFNVPFPVWGIKLEGNTLYAIQDMSDSLAVFENFLSQPEGVIYPTTKVEVEGIVRTHGIYYDRASDIMILTDIGDAGSDQDGAFHVIENFHNKLMDAGDGGTIPLNAQVRVAGEGTYLGNPVDVTLDYQNKKIYVAERARNGGKILGFNHPTQSGSMSPFLNVDYAGAAAVYLSAKK